MIFGIICFIVSLVGIHGFYNDIYILTYLSFLLCLFENIVGRLNGSSKTMMPFFISCLIGFLFTKKIWLGFSIGACFENVITFAGGFVFLLILNKNKK